MARSLVKEQHYIRRDLENEKLCKVYIGDPRVCSAEKILNEREVRTKIEYLIKWSGYSTKHNEWVARQHVTPDLIRTFQEEKKKKQIRILKKEQKAKARVLRRKHGGIAKKSILRSMSTPSTDSSERRSTRLRVNPASKQYFVKSETGSSTVMSGEPKPKCEIPDWIVPKEGDKESDAMMSKSEPKCEIPEWILPKEGDEESDAIMSHSDESDLGIISALVQSQEYSSDGDISMSTLTISMTTSPSKSDGISAEKPKPAAPNQGTKSIVAANISGLMNINEGNGLSVSATLTNSDTTTGSKTDDSLASLTLALSSDSEFDSILNEPFLLGFDELFQPIMDI